MSTNGIKTSQWLVLVCGLALVLGATPIAYGQDPDLQARDRTINTRPVPDAAKMKFRGVVLSRDADGFTIRDRNRVDFDVLLTDDTSIRTHGGFLRRGKKYPVTDILRGLIVEVEGRGNHQGQLVADKIRFNESDMRAATQTDARVGPVEENQARIVGQIDELHAIAAEARQVATMTTERLSALDDYDVQEVVSVNFRVNSAVLSPEAKRQLDDLALKAHNAKGYMIEVAGHADSTGNPARNFRLSQQRAESVVQYLAVNHKIPLRRFITPMGFGETDAVADNTTATGRAQNRRVDVKIIINRGISGNTPMSSATRP